MDKIKGTQRLKRCPFCGGKAEIFYDYTGFYVAQCVVCGSGTLHLPKPEECAERWNSRIND